MSYVRHQAKLTQASNTYMYQKVVKLCQGDMMQKVNFAFSFPVEHLLHGYHQHEDLFSDSALFLHQ